MTVIRIEDRSAATDSVAALAKALVALERRIESERPESIVLADASDSALAAALVAAKLQVPLRAVGAATDPASTNGQLIAQLAGTYTGAA